MSTQGIWASLARPFSPEQVEFKPGAMFNGTAMALAYVDPRHYQERLDEAAGADGWESELTIQGGDLRVVVVCTLTVLGVRRQEVGEELLFDAQEKPAANAVTSATAQAFKRACTAHGLGRHLYFGEQSWQPFEANPKGGFKRWANASAMQSLAARICTGWNVDTLAGSVAPAGRGGTPLGDNADAPAGWADPGGIGTAGRNFDPTPPPGDGGRAEAAAALADYGQVLDPDGGTTPADQDWHVTPKDGAIVVVDPNGEVFDPAVITVPAAFWAKSGAKVPPKTNPSKLTLLELARGGEAGHAALMALAAMSGPDDNLLQFARVAGLVLDWAERQ